MASGIYRIRNTVNGHAYIGSAANIARRWTAHRHALRHHKKSPPKLQRAWDKYGESAFVFEVVLECPADELLTHEQAAIDAEAPYYNTRSQAHSNFGARWSAEANRAKGRPKLQYTVRGVTGSITELAERFGIVSPKVARTRLERGADPETAFCTPRVSRQESGRKAARTHRANGSHPSQKLLTAFGVEAPLATLVEKFAPGMQVKTVRQRLLRGMSPEAALTTPKRVW